jgi:hypothetical protein
MSRGFPVETVAQPKPEFPLSRILSNSEMAVLLRPSTRQSCRQGPFQCGFASPFPRLIPNHSEYLTARSDYGGYRTFDSRVNSLRERGWLPSNVVAAVLHQVALPVHVWPRSMPVA